MLKGKGVRAAADGITPRSFELLVHFWESGRSNLERYDLCGSVDILAEELAKKEKQVSPPPPKPPISYFALGKRGFGMTEEEEEKAHRLKPMLLVGLLGSG